MKRALLIFLSFLSMGSPVVALATEKPPVILTDGARFTVTETSGADAARIPTDLDRVVVGLAHGDAMFVPRGENLKSAEPRVIVIQLKDVTVAPLPNTTGFPDAFPRPGIKKILENARVNVWDYAWTFGQATPMHFHSKQVVVTYLGDGILRSTTASGEISDTKINYGLVTFNPPNRTHTETLVEGMVRAVIVELN